VSSLSNERKIRRESTGVSSSGGLIVGVGRRKVVGELSWTLEHLSLVVGSIGVLDILSEGLGTKTRGRSRDWSAFGSNEGRTTVSRRAPIERERKSSSFVG